MLRALLVALAASALLVGAAHADPTLVGTTSDATVIDNLIVDGVTYDVTFDVGS